MMSKKIFDTKRVASKDDEVMFVNSVIDFVSSKQWTIGNLNDAVGEVIEHMENNAVLQEGCTNDQTEEGMK